MNQIKINGNNLSIQDIVDVGFKKKIVVLDDAAIPEIKKSRVWVESAVEKGEIIYGITTGFGNFKNVSISADETTQLQINILRSHATGVGEPFSEEIVRAIMLLRANSLAKGFSGVRLELIEKLIELINKDVYPYIPCQGSVGSSGDLAPLCHMALVLVGEGECIVDGKRVPTEEVLKEKKITPIELSSKEGLSLSNGTNVQTAALVFAIHEAQKLISLADLTAALSIEVLMGSRMPFIKNISEVRGQIGQIESAKNIWGILEKSPIIDSHVGCDRVQDSYSLRCVPQVHGAARDTIKHVESIVKREINAATDNPLIFADENFSVSGGNFHGEPIAIASDILKIAVAEIGSISERRIAKMIDPSNNDDLPAFLISKDKGGLHSGLMIPQYVAAALVSENKVLAHPASVDSIPTSANQEDHVSMGTIAARQVLEMTKNTKKVLAIELLNNTQAYEFRKEHKLSEKTQSLYNLIRTKVAPITEDRIFYRDIENIIEIIDSSL